MIQSSRQKAETPRPFANKCVPGIRHSSFIIRQFAAALFCSFLHAAASAATVRAYIQPDRAHTGQVVTYVITVQNGTVQSLPQLRLPAQVGMNSGVSTSQNVEIRGNQRVFSTQLAWGVAGTEPGEFVIPPQEVLVNGEVLKTNEVRLTVTEPPTPDTPPGASDDANMPLFQIEVGKTEVYQGEVVPISATLFVPRSVLLRRVGLIDVSKSDFAIARFPQQADQTQTSINGIDYIAVTYRSTLSALHAGDLKVGPATCELLFEVYNEDEQRQMRRGLPFGLMMRDAETRKQIVKSQEVKIKVLPLPEGKPSHFTGAVGDFTLSATASPNELSVGDPLAVDITIDGSGNFDALNPPALMPPDGWKAYPPRRYNVDGPVDPNVTPTAQRRIGYSMVFVPEKVHAELPPFELSFFSPTEKKYVAARTPAIPLRIKPGAAAAAVTGAESSGTASAPKAPAVLQPKPNISDILMTLPAKAEWLVASTAGSVPLTTSARFWAVQSIPALLVIFATFLAWFRRHREETKNGLRGELQQLWRGLEQPNLDDREFLQRAAHFVLRSHPDGVQDPELRQILHRYETRSFTAEPAQEQKLDSGERGRILGALSPLLKTAAVFAAAFVLLGASSFAAEESPDEIYRQAREALEKGKFTQAQYLGESLTKRNPPALSAAVFALIGHARYRQEDFGRAAMWYQRAQLLEPANPEVRQNLRHLDEKLRFFRFGEDSPLAEWSLVLGKNTWIIAASAGVWLILLAVMRCILASSRKAGGGAFALVLSIIGMVIFLPSAAFAAIRPDSGQRVKDVMVVTAKEVSAYTAATLTSGSVIDLPPGSQVRLLEKRGAWSYVEIPSTDEPVRGWVESAVYTPLWPWDTALVP
jgi:tetratricopeptide (TPR) repeat protein